MKYYKAILTVVSATFLLNSCVTTAVKQKAAYLSNDKVYAIQKIDGINIVAMAFPFDKATYDAIAGSLQSKLSAAGVSSNMIFVTDSEDKLTAISRITDEKPFKIFLTRIKKINTLDEMNNPMFQKQMEFLIETKGGDKIVSGLVSIDKETTQAKLGDLIADIIYTYMKSKKLV